MKIPFSTNESDVYALGTETYLFASVFPLRYYDESQNKSTL